MESINDLKTLVSFLPSLSAKTVLQLGADENLIRVLLEHNLNRLVVVEPSENLVSHLRQLNLGENVELIHSEFTKLNLNNQNFDFINLNSAFESLTDDEAVNVVELSLKYLSSGGFFFFRNGLTEKNSKDRSTIILIDLVQSKVVDGQVFDLVFAKPNSSFSTDANHSSRVSFLFTKVKNENYNGYNTLREFMDAKQYMRNGILRYEKIFGAGFVSTGGIDSTLSFLKDLDLKKGQKVLDVGCGIGGGDFLMAKEYDVEVLGIDLSANMVGIALDRALEHKNLKCHFEIGDICKQKYPDNYFDCIYSRDTILHIANKKQLFAQFHKWLKPGGKIFITDYCCGPKPWSDEFTSYVSSRGYYLLTVPEYGDIFSQLGFTNLKAENRTDLFVSYLKSELKKMDEIKNEFVKEFSLEDFNYLIEGWEMKLVRCAAGNQTWGVFYCEK